MKLKVIFIFLFAAFAPLMAQRDNIKVNMGGYVKYLSSVNRKGVDFISVRQLSDLFAAGVYFNSASSKLEVKFSSSYLKFTEQNQFVVVTFRTGITPKVYQIPLPPIRLDDDFFIAFEYCTDIFSVASGRKLEYRKQAKQIVIDEMELPLEKSTVAEKKPETEKPETEKPETEKPVTEKPGTQKPEETSKIVEEEKSASLQTGKDSIESKTAGKITKPEIRDSKFDIPAITIEPKSNGTLIRIICKKKVTRYSAFIKQGIFFINLLGVKLDEEAIGKSAPEGLVRKIKARNVPPNSQIEFYLNEGYSNYEAFQDSPGNDLILTIHNKLLSGNVQPDKIKDKWTLNTVVIDAGHGGKDPGAIGLSGTKEKDVNLSIALKLGEMIQENLPEVKVIYTRSGDRFVELYKRGKIANEKNGNLFISIHCNSTPVKPTDANGFEIYLLRPGRTKAAVSIAERENSVIQYEDNPSHYQKLTDENFILVSMAHSAFMRYSERFSDLLNKQFGHDLSLSSNGIKQAGFYVLVGASMPSVLVETGFISNRKDEAYLAGKTGQTNIAASIFKSIKIFKDEYEKNLQLEMSAKDRADN